MPLVLDVSHASSCPGNSRLSQYLQGRSFIVGLSFTHVVRPTTPGFNRRRGTSSWRSLAGPASWNCSTHVPATARKQKPSPEDVPSPRALNTEEEYESNLTLLPDFLYC